jgi:hypothetical protein
MECVIRTAPSIVKSDHKGFLKHALFEARKSRSLKSLMRSCPSKLLGTYQFCGRRWRGFGVQISSIERCRAQLYCTRSSGSILPVSHLDTWKLIATKTRIREGKFLSIFRMLRTSTSRFPIRECQGYTRFHASLLSRNRKLWLPLISLPIFLHCQKASWNLSSVVCSSIFERELCVLIVETVFGQSTRQIQYAAGCDLDRLLSNSHDRIY